LGILSQRIEALRSEVRENTEQLTMQDDLAARQAAVEAALNETPSARSQSSFPPRRFNTLYAFPATYRGYFTGGGDGEGGGSPAKQKLMQVRRGARR